MNFFSRLFGKKASPPTRVPTEEEWNAITAQYERILREASLACLGGQPPTDPCASWFGGHAVALPTEENPVWDGKPMLPLLQVNCAELPYRPPALANTALLVVWLSLEDMELASKPNGTSWLLREYASLEGLVPVTEIRKPRGSNDLKTLPITWELTEREAPDWDDAETLIDYGDIPLDMMDQRAFERLISEFTNDGGTKVGGYPSLIQYSLDPTGTFVLQIGEVPEANWCDGGFIYFSKTVDGDWIIEYQID